MFYAYKESVLNTFEKMKIDGLLPSALERPTSSKLKKECLDFFMIRYQPKDHETFKSIFGQRNSAEEYYLKIKTSSADKFKPLRNFLKKETDGTHERNIELLAWLIDYQPRPYQPKDAYSVSETIGSKPAEKPAKAQEEISIVTVVEEEKANGSKKLESKDIFGVPKKYDRAIFAFIAVIIVSATFYLLDIFKDKKCMYWAGDRYVKVACDARIPHTLIVDLDTFKLAHFRKITQPDTLTTNDLGKVWRSKINRVVEFYTDSGMHPIDTNIRLLPLSAYMLDKYGHIAK